MKLSINSPLRILQIVLKNSAKQAMHYHSSTLFAFIFSTLFLIAEWLLIDVYYQFTDTIGDWDKHSFYILIGTYNAMLVLYTFFFEIGHDELTFKIRNGELDADLIKPIDAQFMTSFYRFDITSLINLAIPILLVYTGLQGIQAHLNLLSTTLFVLNFFVGVFLIYLINQLTVNLSFWFRDVNNFHLAADQIIQLGSKPFQVYPKMIQICMSFFFPIAISTSLSRNLFFNTYSWKSILFLMLGSCVLFIIVRFQWKLGLKRYQSAN